MTLTELRQRMVEKYKSQAVFAREMGLCRSEITNYLKANRIPPPKRMLKIARLLEVDIKEVIEAFCDDETA